MITRNSSKKHFTLVELLVVLVIVSLILGFIIPAFTKLTRGRYVEIAARMIASQLNLARAEAISRRCNVAVFIIGRNIPSGVPNSNENWEYSAFRAAYVDGNGTFQDWVPGTQWTTIPQGALILFVNHTNTSPLLNNNTPPAPAPWTLPTPPDNYYPSIYNSQNNQRNVGGTDCRWVAFTPKGYSINGDVCISICEGIAGNNSDYGFIRSNFANCIVLQVSRFTGHVSYLYNGKL